MRNTGVLAFLALVACQSADPRPVATDRDAALSMVQALRLSGDCRSAAPILERLQKETPVDLGVMLETAKCEFLAGRLARAAEVLTAAVRLHPESSEAATVLGATLDHLERPADARVQHDRAVTLAPASAMALSNKAISVALSGDFGEALGLMRKASTLPNAPARVRFNLALLEAVAGNGDVASVLAKQEAGDPETVRLLERIAAAAKR